MKVRELIEILQALPEEKKELEIKKYIPECECSFGGYECFHVNMTAKDSTITEEIPIIGLD